MSIPTNWEGVEVRKLLEEIPTKGVKNILFHRRVQIVEEVVETLMLVIIDGHFQIFLYSLCNAFVGVIPIRLWFTF